MHVKILRCGLAISIAINVLAAAIFWRRHLQTLAAAPRLYGSAEAVDSRVLVDRRARFEKLPPQKTDVLLLGDSVAAALVSDLEDRQREGDEPSGWTNVSVHQRAVPGVKTPGLLSMIPYTVGLKPKKILVWCGTNDLGSQRSIGDITATYDQIITQLQNSTPASQLIILSVLPINRPGDDNEKWNTGTKQLNVALRAIASAHKVKYIDLTPAVLDSTGHLDGSLTEDGLHPTAPGMSRLEKILGPVVSLP